MNTDHDTMDASLHRIIAGRAGSNAFEIERMRKWELKASKQESNLFSPSKVDTVPEGVVSTAGVRKENLSEGMSDMGGPMTKSELELMQEWELKATKLEASLYGSTNVKTPSGGTGQKKDISDEDYRLKSLAKGHRSPGAEEASAGAEQPPLPPTRTSSGNPRSSSNPPEASTTSNPPEASDGLTRPSWTSSRFNSRRSRFLSKNNVDFSDTSANRPGAYAGAPGEDYGRLDTINDLQRILTNHHRGCQEDQETGSSTGVSLDVESGARYGLDSSGSLIAMLKRQPALFAGVLALLLVIIVVSTVIPIVMRGDPVDDPSPANGASKYPDSPMEYDVPDLANYTLEALENPSSIQGLAYAWVRKTHGWDDFDDWRKQQRFAVVCAISGAKGLASFSMAMGFAVKDAMLLSHECDWVVDGLQPICDDEKVVGLTWLVARSIQGSIPPEISLLPNLRSIVFSGGRVEIVNTLEKLLPLTTPNSLSSLKELHLSDCNMGGTIPSSIGLLAGLTSLDLSMSRIDSTIPSELGLLSNLNTLLLASNRLSGTIPDQLGELSALKSFSIEDNPSLEASMPLGFCSNNHTTMELLSTDWCSGTDDCCPL